MEESNVNRLNGIPNFGEGEVVEAPEVEAEAEVEEKPKKKSK